MSRTFAALLVVVAAFAISAAQNSPKPEPMPRIPFGGGKAQLPWDVIEVDGKQAWQVAGRGNVRVEELIGGLANSTGLRITYDATGASMSKNSVPYVGSDAGTVVPNAELADYVSDLIAGAQLTIVGHSAGKARVVSLEAAHGYARAVESAELAGLPDSEWVSIARTGLGKGFYEYDELFRSFRTANVMIEIDQGVFSASGRVAQMRNVAAILAKVEAVGSGGTVIGVYDLTGNVKAADAQRVISDLFAASSTTVDDLEGKGYRVRAEERRDVTVSVVPGSNRLLVRASAADHRLVKAALDAMK